MVNKAQVQAALDLRHDYERLAQRANLRYVSDDEPGLPVGVGVAALPIEMQQAIRSKIKNCANVLRL